MRKENSVRLCCPACVRPAQRRLRALPSCAACVALILLVPPAVPAEGLAQARRESNPVPKCFSKYEKKSLQTAKTVEKRIPEYTRLTDWRASRWGIYLFAQHRQHWPEEMPDPITLDAALTPTNCLSPAIVEDLSRAAIPYSEENETNPGELSRALARLTHRLHYALLDDYFFDPQKDLIHGAGERVEDAHAVIRDSIRQHKEAHVSFQRPQR